MTVGAACRLLHITTFLYHSTGAFSRILLCGIPLAGIVAWWIGPRYGFEVWSIAYATALIPTLCAYHVCFSISSALFPEIGGILHRLTPLRARVVRKIVEWLDKN